MRQDLQKYHPSTASRIVVREAVGAGLFDWGFGDADLDTAVTGRFLNWMERQSAGRDTVRKESAGLSPESIHIRIHNRPLQEHPDTVAPFRAWSVELARFDVPNGYVGIVKGFEQYLAHQAIPQGDTAFVYTSSARWGIPWTRYSGNAFELPDGGTWHFRLSRIGSRPRPWWNEVGPQAVNLPDNSYPDFPSETGLWWPAGSAASQNVHMVIPAGYSLRVIWYQAARALGARVEVAARLKGYVQSDSTAESRYNVRSRW
jgi:hypothetical protein